ncbi:GNAT family N-acetyltransferase [Amycolatopsis sp. H6(2020)]|nr:GNAT family N-acetyltransferase [Amycolatopsis sp. H6(2020)]
MRSVLKWLVVDPRARGRGIAAALIAYARTQLPAGTLWIGGCAAVHVDFYRKHDFQVLAPGEPLISPHLPARLANDNRDAPHWFVRQALTAQRSRGGDRHARACVHTRRTVILSPITAAGPCPVTA